MNRALFILLCAALLSAFAARPSRADEDAGKLLDDSWAMMLLADSRCGYIHTVVRSTADPEPHIVTTVFSEIRMRRFGDFLTVRNTSTFTETPDGALLAVRSINASSTVEQRIEAEVHGDKIAVTTTTLGKSRTTELPWDPKAIGPAAQERLLRQTKLEPGASVSFKTFAADLGRMVESTLTIEAREEVRIMGEQRAVFRGRFVQDALPGVATRVWVDDEGITVRSKVQAMLQLEIVLCTREEALRDIAPRETTDLMTQLAIKSTVRFPTPARVSEALYRLEGEGDALARLELDDRRQTVEKRDGNVVFLRVRALAEPAYEAAEAPGDEFLSASAYVQSDDKEIVRLAAEAVGEAKGNALQAQLLARWVRKNITSKGYGVGLASAKEVVVTREGDCTEHAVLLAALLRAQNIPARVAVGVVYYKGDFLYHMWTEAYLGGWTALDATQKSFPVDATHIRLAHSSLKSEAPLAFVAPLASVVGKLKLTVVEYKD